MTYHQFAQLSHLTRTFSQLKTVPARVGVNLARWRDSLRPWASHHENAFWGLSHRIEARHGHPARIWFWAVLVFALFAMTTSPIWNSRQAEQARLPPSEFRDAFGFLAMLWFSIFLGAAFVAARLRSAAMLRAMLLKGQLLPLQHVPLENENLAWHLTAPAALIGLIAALGALPGLAFGIGHGDWTARDLLGLCVLLVMGLWSVPKWTPGVWQTQIEKTAVAAKGDGFWKPSHLGISWTGWRSVFFSAGLVAGADPSLLLVPLQGIFQGLAPEVQQLLPGIWTNWPLLLSRFLVAPLPFFGFALPPICLLLPLWMATQDRKLLRLTSVLGADRLFWTPTRQERWQRDDCTLALLWLVVSLGYCWPSLVNEGALALYWGDAKTAVTPQTFALATWFYMCVFGASTAATALWRETMEHRFAERGQKAPTPREICPLAWARAGQALFIGLVIWLGCCVLGWQAPLSAVTLGEAAMTLAVGALWILVQTTAGLALAAGSHPQTKKEALACGPNPMGTSFWWFYGLSLAVCVPLWFLWKGQYWQPWMLSFSPFSLWLAPRIEGTLSAPWFWSALAAHATFGLWWLRRVWRILPAFQPQDISENGSTRPQRSDTQERLWSAFDWKPVPTKAPAGKVRPNRLSRSHLFPPTHPQRRLLDLLRGFDNPLLILETRRLMGHANWIGGWLSAAAYGLLGFIVLFGLLLRDRNTFELTSGALFIFGTLGIIGLIALIGYGTHANDSYDRDRLDGTLEALFLSPLSEAAIAQSKIVPHLLSLWPPTLFMWAFLLLAAVMAMFDGEYRLVPLSVAITVALLALTARNVTLSHWLAVTSKKTGQGSTRMALIATPLHILEASILIFGINESLVFFSFLALSYPIALTVEAVVLWKASVERLKILRQS